MEDGSRITFCEKHWSEVGRKLRELGPRYKALLDQGVNPKIAIARLSAELVDDWDNGGERGERVKDG